MPADSAESVPNLIGLHYFYHEGGGQSRPPVLLLHGAGGDHLSWPAEIRRLPEARVVALDLPGHGKSQGHGFQAVPDYARLVVKFVDALGVRRVVLVGHCMGGAVALRLAIDYPDYVAGAVLIASGARLPIAASILDNAANVSTLPLALQALQELSCGPQASPAVRESSFRRLQAARQTLLHGDLLACDRFDASQELGAVRTPVLVLCGTQDRLTPLSFSQALAQQIPGAALQTIEDAGHLLLLEQPGRLSKLVSVFLSTLPAA